MASRHLIALLTCLAAAIAPTLLAQQPDLNDQFEKAVKDAARKVAPSVVQIQTQGGSDMIVTGAKGPTLRKALGPTTGVIVDADGYIISSAFNFSNNPASIIVSVPGHKEPLLAKRIATDNSRMLTLIKVEKQGLPVPAFVPNNELKVGQSALAMGRTLDVKALDLARDHPPSISHGIISALGRVWGKAIQTDAKVSPINYGGPLVDITGRVQGIIVPASPTGDDVAAGLEWYDSGIGFAIPMEDVMAVVPKLKKGKDLEKATLGIKLKSKDKFSDPVEVGGVTPGSAADKAGLKAGDVVTEIDGKKIASQAQLQHALGPKYVGDSISLKFRRGKDEQTVAKVEFVPAVAAKYQHPFLGILPMRDDPKLGVEIRYVFAKSPADAAGLKAGDRIVKYGNGKDPLVPFKGGKRGRDELADFLNLLSPGNDIALGVVDKDGNGKADVVMKLEAMPGSQEGKDDKVPDRLPAKASQKKALEPLEIINAKVKPGKDDKPGAGAPGAQGKKAVTGLVKRTNAAGDRKFWIYVHKDYNPQVAHALVVWLHQPNKFSDDDNEKTTDAWEEYCKENNIILVGPITEQEGGWTPSDADLVHEAVNDAIANYTIDRNRVITHGMGNGGQMAFYLAFKARELVSAAAAIGAVMTEAVENLANPRLAIYMAAGDRDPVIAQIRDTHTRLVNSRIPVLLRVFPNRGREYLDDSALGELARWIDMLDRL